MNRKLLNGLLVLAVAAGGVGTFTSCKDDDFKNDVLLGELSLQAQIDAIRSVNDETFKKNLEEWLNNWTDELSSEFGSYEEMVACADAMWRVYDDIMNNYPNISEETEKYISNLYDWMFNNEISVSDWYDLIYKVAGRATSVGVNSVKNPIFGTVNLPLGINTTVLATYMYEGAEYSFPTEITYSRVTESSPINDQDEINSLISVIKGLKGTSVDLINHSFTDAKDLGNMGGAIITINPSGNDYTDASKYTIELVNSKGDVVLTNAMAEAEEGDGDDSDATPAAAATETVAELELVEYDGLLHFGASRGENNPGVYALKANATADNYETFKVDLENKSALKNALKDAINNKTISSVAHLGKTIFDQINTQLPAYAVKVSWEENVVDQASGSANMQDDKGNTVTDDQGNPVKNTIVNSVYSDFDLAAAVVHPLSYGTNIGAYIPSGKSLPILHNSLVEYLEKVQNRITLDLKNVDGIDENDVEFKLAVIVEGGYVYAVDSEGNKMGEGFPYTANGITATDAALESFTNAVLDAVSVELTDQVKSQIVEQINEAIIAINDALDQANEQVDKINNYLEKLKNRSELDYAQKLLDIYNELAMKANNFLKNPNYYLQVVMGYSLDGMPHFMSNDIYMPKTFYVADGANLDLLPTSYTADMVIPSYQKYVAVTGIVEADNSISTTGLDALNTGDLNKVFSGHKEKISVPLAPLQGKTVRLTYVSVDYRGVCSVANYYMTVK